MRLEQFWIQLFSLPERSLARKSPTQSLKQLFMMRSSKVVLQAQVLMYTSLNLAPIHLSFS